MEFDRDVAERQGRDIVRRLAAGESPFLSTVVDPVILDDQKSEPFHSIALEGMPDYSRRLHPDFVARGTFDVTDRYIEYLRGLFRVSRFERQFGFVDKKFFMPDELAFLPPGKTW